MPVSWNAFMDQRLLVAVLAAVKLDTAVVVVKWQELFGKEDISQPTQRAIVEHIGKLKKTVGISSGKSATSTNGVKKEPKGPKTPKNKKQKVMSAPLTPPGSADQDDDEQFSVVKDDKQKVPDTPSKKAPKTKISRGKASYKRKRADLSDEEELMFEGSDVDDDTSTVELPAVKNEDDEFVVPTEVVCNDVPAAARSQRPRRAKAERRPILFHDDTTDEEEAWVVGEQEKTDHNIKREEAAV